MVFELLNKQFFELNERFAKVSIQEKDT